MTIFKKLFGTEVEEDEGEDFVVDETEEELILDDEPLEAVEEPEEGQLALDVWQDKDNVYLQSTIAGVRPEDLDVTVASDVVTIRGERKREREINEEDFFYSECYWGAFSRALPLPVEVDVDKVGAEIKDGVLTVTLPKASSSRTKKVKVRGEE